MIMIFVVIGTAFAVDRASAADEPPITILSAGLERDGRGDLELTAKYRANESFSGFFFDEQWFDKDGKEITDNGGPPPTDPSKPFKAVPRTNPTAPTMGGISRGGGHERGKTYLLMNPFVTHQVTPFYNDFPTVSQIVLIKCRLKYVLLEGTKVWFPPKDKPITFEARFKQPEEKELKEDRSRRVGEPPITIVSAEIGPCQHINSWYEIDRTTHTNKECYPLGKPCLIVQVRANQSFLGWGVETKSFDKLGNDITDDGLGQPLPNDRKGVKRGTYWEGGLDKRGETAVYELPLPKDAAVALLKCRVTHVRCGDNTPWTLWKPPVDHPITFEAKLKDTDKH